MTSLRAPSFETIKAEFQVVRDLWTSTSRAGSLEQLFKHELRLLPKATITRCVCLGLGRFGPPSGEYEGKYFWRPCHIGPH